MANRQDVIDSVAALMMRRVPHSKLDPSDWKASLHRAYADAREVHRGYPRATLISLDERVRSARAAAQRPRPTSDDKFWDLVELRIVGIERLLQ